MSDPRQYQFWLDEDGELWDEVAPLILDIFYDGVRGGEKLLPPAARVLIDWDVVNERAIDWLRGYHFDLIRGINETTRTQTQKALEEWIRSGESLDVLEARLGPVFSPQRAHNIAVTETTRAYASANGEAWAASGVVEEFDVMTAEDIKVCEICEGKADNNPYQLGDDEGEMPFHTGCRCWKHPRVSEKKFREQVRGILEE